MPLVDHNRRVNKSGHGARLSLLSAAATSSSLAPPPPLTFGSGEEAAGSKLLPVAPSRQIPRTAVPDPTWSSSPMHGSPGSGGRHWEVAPGATDLAIRDGQRIRATNLNGRRVLWYAPDPCQQPPPPWVCTRVRSAAPRRSPHKCWVPPEGSSP